MTFDPYEETVAAELRGGKYEGMITEEIIEAKAQEQGRRQAVEALKKFLDYGLSHTFEEAWLAHVVDAAGDCDCTIDKDWDNGYDEDYCKWYKENRHAQYLQWHGMTEEEFAAKQRAEAEERARQKATAEAREKAHRHERLLELAEEFGVDPKLLP